MMRTLDDSLGFQVNQLAGAMKTAIEARLAPFGLTAQQWATMMRLLERDGWPQKDLGESQGMDKATVGGIIARLEHKGLIAREADPDDGRVNRVTLTSVGRRLATELKPLADEVNGCATADLTLEERTQLVSLLLRARNSLIR